MQYVFGYGSLLSPASVTRTLSHPLSEGALVPCIVIGYTRTWTAQVTVYVGGSPVKALFLDLTSSQSAQCNGVLIRVSDEDLELLDIREPGYRRRPVDALVEGRPVSAIAYIVPDKDKTREGPVLSEYVGLLDEALRHYPESFIRQYRHTTEEPPRPLLEGPYRFKP